MSGDYVLSRFIITVHMQIYESYKNKLYLILEHITFTCMHLADAFFNTFFLLLLFFSYQTSFIFFRTVKRQCKRNEMWSSTSCPASDTVWKNIFVIRLHCLWSSHFRLFLQVSELFYSDLFHSYPSTLHFKCNTLPGDLLSKFTISESHTVHM